MFSLLSFGLPTLVHGLVEYSHVFEDAKGLAESSVLFPLPAYTHAFTVDVGYLLSYTIPNSILKRCTWPTLAAIKWTGKKRPLFGSS